MPRISRATLLEWPQPKGHRPLFFWLFGLALISSVLEDVWYEYGRVHLGTLYPWQHPPAFPVLGIGWMLVVWIGSIGAGISMAFPKNSRPALIVGVFCTMIRLSQCYSNHLLLILIVLVILIMPPKSDLKWRLRLVQYQLAIVYFFSALNKVLAGFISVETLPNLKFFMIDQNSLLSNMFGSTIQIHSLRVSALITTFEFVIPLLLLWFPRFSIISIGLMHFTFCLFLPGVFSFAVTMLSMAALYLPSDSPFSYQK